ncbi:hypothetical protein AB0K00_40025 [Dactylosporangium sp. NPDC049525]
MTKRATGESTWTPDAGRLVSRRQMYVMILIGQTEALQHWQVGRPDTA